MTFVHRGMLLERWRAAWRWWRVVKQRERGLSKLLEGGRWKQRSWKQRYIDHYRLLTLSLTLWLLFNVIRHYSRYPKLLTTSNWRHISQRAVFRTFTGTLRQSRRRCQVMGYESTSARNIPLWIQTKRVPGFGWGCDVSWGKRLKVVQWWGNSLERDGRTNRGRWNLKDCWKRRRGRDDDVHDSCSNEREWWDVMECYEIDDSPPVNIFPQHFESWVLEAWRAF